MRRPASERWVPPTSSLPLLPTLPLPLVVPLVVLLVVLFVGVIGLVLKTVTAEPGAGEVGAVAPPSSLLLLPRAMALLVVLSLPSVVMLVVLLLKGEVVMLLLPPLLLPLRVLLLLDVLLLLALLPALLLLLLGSLFLPLPSSQGLVKLVAPPSLNPACQRSSGKASWSPDLSVPLRNGGLPSPMVAPDRPLVRMTS
jgi:hypothetical protein